MKKDKIKIGIIGGSGFYELPGLKQARKIKVSTKYGKTSDVITVGKYNGEMVAFLPRHGCNHYLPPHKIPYKANILALRNLGVEYIFAFCAAGSLNLKIKPGDFVVLDQLVNFTWGRDIVLKEDDNFVHLSMENPYSKKLSDLVYKNAKKEKLKIHKSGTVVVIQGPRFNTKAESIWFCKQGWDVVNMTQYPECYFAKEFGMSYVGIAMITDYDIGLKKYGVTMSDKSIDKVASIFKNNIAKARKLITVLVKELKVEKANYREVNNITPYYIDMKLK